MGRSASARKRRARGSRNFPLGPLAPGQGADADPEAAAILNPGTTHNPEAPPPITDADRELVCTDVAAELCDAYQLDAELCRNLTACLCDAVKRGGSFTDRALQHYAEQGALCLRLHVPPSKASDADLHDDLVGALDRHTQRWRSKGHKLRGGIARASFRRAPKPRPPRENGCMSCGSKRACRKHTITREESIAWGIANCGGGKQRKKGGPVGGNYSDARRAAGLWDADQPVDEGDVPGRAGSRYSPGNPNAGFTPPANIGPDGASIGPDSAMTQRSVDWQAAKALGYLPCQTPGSTTSCFDPRSGINRSWSVTGRHFTPRELADFSRIQCTPSCDAVPVTRGAPLDATVRVRRVAPRNPAVKRILNCAPRRPPFAPPSFTLKPLPNIAPTPGAVQPKINCVPDQVIGVDGGMFGSGWWIVIRGGRRLLVPNPECCGTDCTAALR